MAASASHIIDHWFLHHIIFILHTAQNFFAIFEFQPLATGVAFKQTVSHHNCQRNYTRSYKHKLSKFKEAKITKK